MLFVLIIPGDKWPWMPCSWQNKVCCTVMARKSCKAYSFPFRSWHGAHLFSSVMSQSVKPLMQLLICEPLYMHAGSTPRLMSSGAIPNQACALFPVCRRHTPSCGGVIISRVVAVLLELLLVIFTRELLFPHGWYFFRCTNQLLIIKCTYQSRETIYRYMSGAKSSMLPMVLCKWTVFPMILNCFFVCFVGIHIFPHEITYFEILHSIVQYLLQHKLCDLAHESWLYLLW